MTMMPKKQRRVASAKRQQPKKQPRHRQLPILAESFSTHTLRM
ncbi:unnamed protein product [Protopolystoma xenopodis]|uniref:Uncharacterized protein n=1 Tax=Protopolystoma xenopodis TaxID=117903 RepID=A0A3S5FEP8_9PLAT|nr:unnamed protein product [Protopolystoma xenopodis]